MTRITEEPGRMKAGGPIAGGIVLVLGVIILVEGLLGMASSTSFIFSGNINRRFEFLVGLVTIVLAAAVMDLSRS